MADHDRTASLMTPSKLAQMKPKAAASPSAWLSQMAADAGHLHVKRLRELRARLQELQQLRDSSAPAFDFSPLAEALPRLDFGLLQSRGWWARTTGKSRGEAAEFAAQFQEIEQVVRSVAAGTREFAQQRQSHAASADLPLLELDVEYHAIDQIIDQGARWLQDMRNQIKAAQSGAADDAKRCEILVARLKTLRAVSSAAQQVHQQAQAATARHAALHQLLQHTLASAVKAWQARLAAVAAAALGDESKALGLDEPMEAHRELQLCVKQAVAECTQLRAQQTALADSVAALGAQLEPA
jgi:hypothetical protein